MALAVVVLAEQRGERAVDRGEDVGERDLRRAGGRARSRRRRRASSAPAPRPSPRAGSARGTAGGARCARRSPSPTSAGRSRAARARAARARRSRLGSTPSPGLAAARRSRVHRTWSRVGRVRAVRARVPSLVALATVEPVKPDYRGANVDRAWCPRSLGPRPVELAPGAGRGRRAPSCCSCSTGSAGRRSATHRGALPELAALDRRADHHRRAVDHRRPRSRRSPPGCRRRSTAITGFRMRVDDAVLNVIRWQRADGGRPPDPFRGAAPRAVPRPRRSRSSPSSEFRNTRVHRGAPARRRVPRLADHVGARRARAARSSSDGDAVRVRVLPGRRRGRARVRARTTTYYPAELAAADRARRRAARRAARRRRAARHRRPRRRCTSARRLDRPRRRSTTWSTTVRGRRAVPLPPRAHGCAPASCAAAARAEFGDARVGVHARRSCSTRAGSGPDPVAGAHRRRVGDVVLAAAAPASGFVDPTLPQEAGLVGAHGSLTAGRDAGARCSPARGRRAYAGASVGRTHTRVILHRLSTGLWTRPWIASSRSTRSRDGEVVRPPPPAHRVLDARRCGADRRRRRHGRGRRPARGRHHRPRQHVRRPRLLPGGARRRPHAGDRHRGLHGHRRAGSTGRVRDDARHLPPHAARRDPRRATATSSRSRRTRTSTASTRSPRVDFELLEQHHEGLVATTGCLGGAVLAGAAARTTTHGARDARRPASRTIFGRDSFFIELQDHGLPEQHAGQPAADRDRARRCARRCSPPTTATTRTATTPSRTTRCCACRPAAPSTTRSASSSTPRSST